MKFGSLYTCSGHWTLAGQMAGITPQWHTTMGKANEILKDNFPDLPIEVDGPVEVIAGSPPCVGFSRANTNREKQHEDRQYVLDYAKKVIDLEPVASVMEMCTGWRDFDEHRQYMQLFEDAGWKVNEFTLNGWDQGGTQKRKRAFTVASPRLDVGDLEFRDHKGSCPVDAVSSVEEPGYHFVPDGKIKGPFGIALRWKSRRLEPGKPSWVITKRATHMIYHPTEDRGLGVNELAALMGFPAWYDLPSNSTALQHIGPGVDVRAATNILRDVKEWIDNE